MRKSAITGSSRPLTSTTSTCSVGGAEGGLPPVARQSAGRRSDRRPRITKSCVAKVRVRMDVAGFCRQTRVLIVAGKGGVGKTTVTAALARMAARAGLTTLIVEVEGKSGLASAFGVERPSDLRRAGAAGGRAGRGRRARPDPHPRRRAARVPRGPRACGGCRSACCRQGALDVVATAVPGIKDILVLGKVKQLERAADRRPDRPRRAGGRSRGHLPDQRVGTARRGAGRTDPHAGPGRGRPAVRPDPLPGDARHPAGGDAGQRGRRDGVRARGPGRGRPWRRSSSTASIPRSPDWAPIPRRRPRRPTSTSTRRRRRRSGGRDVPSTPDALQAEQVERLAEALPLAQLRLPFLFTTSIGPDEIERLAIELAASVEAMP